MNFDGVISIQRRRPRWWRERPDVSLDHRSPDAEKPPLITLVLDAAQRLEPGQTLSLKLDFEPLLLYRLLDDKGFERWSEPAVDGDLRIDILRPRRAELAMRERPPDAGSMPRPRRSPASS